jgi:hypothetical protein
VFEQVLSPFFKASIRTSVRASFPPVFLKQVFEQVFGLVFKPTIEQAVGWFRLASQLGNEFILVRQVAAT